MVLACKTFWDLGSMGVLERANNWSEPVEQAHKMGTMGCY